METNSFGPFTLEISAARLFRDGVEIRLRPQAFKALSVLSAHRGQYVSYERMIAEAWDGTIVSRHTVDVTLGEVRRALKEYGEWIDHRAKVGHCLSVPQADDLIARARLLSNLRTREGLEQAVECFQHAALDDPHDFRAFEGQAASYLMLATSGMRAPLDMYPAFLDTLAQAEALTGLTPELRCNRAHGWHMVERRLSDAEAELQHVIRESPAMGPAYVRLAMVYITMGRLDEALETVTRAYRVAPLLPLVPATDAVVRLFRREFDQAVTIGAKSVQLHPFLSLGRAFYAQALEYAGCLDDALAQYEIGAVVSSGLSWLRALQGNCLVKLGRVDEARTILDELDARRRTEYVDACSLAVLRRSLGQRDEAFAELARAVDERSSGLFALEVDPKMDCFRSDPRYRRLLDRLHEDTVATR